MSPERVFAGIGAGFGAVFVIVNATALPTPWEAVAFATGAVLLGLALWRGLLFRAGSGERWDGSASGYWLAVAAEVVAIPAGAYLLNHQVNRPHLVVLWVVFVVGAHFLPAQVFGIGRYAELGLTLIVVAAMFAALSLVDSDAWVPSAGAVIAGLVLLGFVAVPRLSRPRA